MSLDAKTQEKLGKILSEIGDPDERSSLERILMFFVAAVDDLKKNRYDVTVKNPVSTMNIPGLKDLKPLSKISIDNWEKMPLPKMPDMPRYPTSIEVSNFPDKISIGNFPKQITVANLREIKFPEFPKIPQFPTSLKISNLKEIKFPEFPKFPEITIPPFPETIGVSNLKDIKFPKTLNVNVKSGIVFPNFPVYKTVNEEDKRLSVYNSTDEEFLMLADYVGGTDAIYIGKAVPGSATSDEKWKIRKFTYDGNHNILSILFADGVAAYDKIWDDRADYDYS